MNPAPVADDIKGRANFLEIDFTMPEQSAIFLRMKFANVFAEVANFFADVIAHIGRVAQVVIDPHGFRADPIDNLDFAEAYGVVLFL